MNNCPLAGTCAAWRLHQRDTLLLQLVDSCDSYSQVFWLLELAWHNRPAPVGHEWRYRLARDIVSLGISTPATKGGLSLALSRAKTQQEPCC